MKLAYGQRPESDQDAPAVRRATSGSWRFIQAIGAIFVTAFALWFLFGIPAYLLFGQFFE